MRTIPVLCASGTGRCGRATMLELRCTTTPHRQGRSQHFVSGKNVDDSIIDDPVLKRLWPGNKEGGDGSSRKKR